MRILVTGATGFVGRALVACLVTSSHQVRAANRAQGHGLPPAVENHPVGDIGPETDWRKALDGMDVVVHLAARVHMMGQVGPESESAYRRINTEGTRRLALNAAEAGVKRIIFLSTVKVLGKTCGAQPWSDASPPAPADPYAVSKWEAEQVLFEIGAANGLEVVILRPPLVYGPGLRGNFLRIMQLCRWPLPLPFGAIDNRRSLIYVGNLVDAILQSLDQPSVAGNAFLISDGNPVSTQDLIQGLCRAMGHRAFLVPVPVSLLRRIASLAGRKADIERLTESLVIDDSRFSETVGWKRPFSFERALCTTVDWYLHRGQGSEHTRMSQ